MDRVYRTLLTVCLILGIQIHLPVTMFPASDIPEVKEPFLSVKQQQEFNTTKYILQWSRNEFIKPHLEGHDRNIPNHKSVIGSDYEGLNGIKRNQFQTVAHSRDLKGLMGFSESDPLKHTEKDTHLSMRNDFIRAKLKQTKEKLANISNIFIKNIAPHKNHRQNDGKEDEPFSNNTHDRSITEGATWTAELVKQCPKSFSTDDLYTWKQKVQNNEIIKIEEGCGSMQNRLVTFNDSTKACVRYRYNVDLMQGEIYSFYLSKIINIGHTAPTTLHKIENNKQWSKVWTDISKAKWSESKPVIFTKWIENLEPVFMPPELKNSDMGINENTNLFTGKTVSELCDLVQWSNLVIFDYMSANPDRVVNNMFNLKWNDKMMDKPIHNLEKSADNGAFVFLDNESGLFHGYRLLDTHDEFHRQLLNSVCIFTPETVRTIEELYMEGNIGNRLVDAFVSGEKYQNMLPRISFQNLNTLQSRLKDVYKHIQSCKLKLL